MKPHINVVAAAIVKDGKLLALRRSDGDEPVAHKFEFVGGKVEQGETPQEALIRECKEELSLDIEVGDLLNTIDYEYPKTLVTLSVYFVRPLSDYKLTVHEEEKWIDCSELDPTDWAPADKAFLSTLKKGSTSLRMAKIEHDFNTLREIAFEVMHETFDSTLAQGQVDYMLNAFLSKEAVEKCLGEKEYSYILIYLNGEAVGFFSYCPAKYFNPEYTSGTFLSKLYIKKFARGKKIASKILASLMRPVYLTVKKDNNKAVNIYKHCGFKILQSVTTDIGEGYVMDDFIMRNGK
ncbi:MAG: GNAT family N-acetyltransferase [Clostridia bacterium]|nr:GNAT family N-acetyltransferase [Clostridia bacterium]